MEARWHRYWASTSAVPASRAHRWTWPPASSPSDRKKLDTPHPAKPDAVAAVVQDLVKSFAWTGPIGTTFPGVVTGGTIRTAANLDQTGSA